jgi:hypothetical protein
MFYVLLEDLTGKNTLHLTENTLRKAKATSSYMLRFSTTHYSRAIITDPAGIEHIGAQGNGHRIVWQRRPKGN